MCQADYDRRQLQNLPPLPSQDPSLSTIGPMSSNPNPRSLTRTVQPRSNAVHRGSLDSTLSPSLFETLPFADTAWIESKTASERESEKR